MFCKNCGTSGDQNGIPKDHGTDERTVHGGAFPVQEVTDMKRKMNKYLARLCLCMMLVYLLAPALSMPAYAEEKECWVLQEVFVFKNLEVEREGITGTYEEYGDVRLHIVQPELFTFDVTAQASPLPNSFRPGDTVMINYDIDLQADILRETSCVLEIGGKIRRYPMPENFEPRVFWENKWCQTPIESQNLMSDSSWHSLIRAGIGSDEVGDRGEIMLHRFGTKIVQDGSQLSGRIPGGQAGEVLVIDIYYNVTLQPQIQETYIYTWEGTTTQEVINEAGNGPGETGEEIDSGVINPGSNHGGSGDDSGWTGGDHGDDGGNIVGTIAKVGGGVAAAGIAVKAIKGVIGKSGGDGGNGGKGKKKKKREEEFGDDPQDNPQDNPRDEQKNEQKKDDEKKRYEMRVYKEFGDTIYAGKTVTLSARIVEISASGVERTVPELTNQISISSQSYLQVGGTFPSGQYQSARVTAPEYDEAVPSTAVVTFCLMAPGGSFTQHMRFKIKQADPSVVWPDLQRGADPYLEIIAGDNATYPVRFFFHDVSEEPEKIEFGRYNDYEITVEPADTMYTYWAMVKNCTAPLENKIYQPVSRYPSGTVKFTATFKDGLKLEGYFDIVHYPDGLSVVTDLEDGRIPVQAYEKEYYGDLDSPYPMSGLRYSCAHRTENGVEVFQPYEEDLRYGSLQGDRGETDNNVAMKYPYRADVWGFMPLKTLNEPSPGATYLMKIDVVWKEKPDDVLTLPLTFHLKPKGCMEEWQEEFVKLRKSIIAFAPDEDLPKNVERLKHLTPYNSSPNELYLMTQAIRNAYIEYWESEYNRAMDLDDSLEWWGDAMGWVKFVGDCAFSYLIYYYASASGSVAAAPYIDAIASAGKDIFASIGGRYIGAWWSGEALYLDGFVKECNEVGKSALDDCIFEMIPDNPKSFFKSPSIKKVGLVIAAYMMVNFAMNLAKIRYDMDDPETQAKLDGMSYEERLEETSWGNSIYAALIATFKDMSVRVLTSIVGSKVEKYLKDPKVQKKLGNFVTNVLDTWWKAEKTMRITGISVQRNLSGPAKKLYEIKALRTEALEKLAYGFRDIQSITNRSKSFNTWKNKVVQSIQSLPEAMVGKELMNNVKFSDSIKLLRNPPKKAIQGGMIMDKIITKGAGIVYDLASGKVVEYSGQVVDCFGMMVDLNNMDNANKAAAEMEEQVQAKHAEMSAKAAVDELYAMIEQVTAEIESAETPEIAEKAVGRFLDFFGEIDMPEDESNTEEEEDDYEFDSTPEFKTGSDGCMYVVTKLRKPGTEKGYRIEYNLNKIFTDGLDSEMFVEFFKLFFGGKLPDFPETQAPMPAAPPLPSELR